MPPTMTNDEEANANNDQQNDDGNGSEQHVTVDTTTPTTPTPTTVDLSPTSIANAEHLDHLESSEAISDIASFQDIELPPQQSIGNVGNNATTKSDQANNNNNGPRRAKKFYYCLPMIQMHKFSVMGCLLVLFLIFLAIGLSANSMNQKNEALGSNKNKDVEDDRGEMILSDAPPSTLDWNVDGDAHVVDDNSYEQGPSFPLSMDGDGDGNVDTNLNEDNNGDENEEDGDEELGDPLEVDVPENGTQPPRESIKSTISPTTSSTTNKPTLSPTYPDKTSAPTDPHPLNPQWFQTTHTAYQDVLTFHTNISVAMHPHDMAGLFCNTQNLTLCSYDAYCPNGQASPGYKGGPPIPEEHSWNEMEETQWAPFYAGGGTDGKEDDWVQVGVIPDSDSGNADNGFGECWTFHSWWDLGQVTFDEVVRVDHRRWMLCCEVEDGGIGGV